jgi:hypothetical protein
MESDHAKKRPPNVAAGVFQAEDERIDVHVFLPAGLGWLAPLPLPPSFITVT